MKAQALRQKGQNAEAHRVLEEALKAAQEIPDKMGRDTSIGMISNTLKASEKDKK